LSQSASRLSRPCEAGATTALPDLLRPEFLLCNAAVARRKIILAVANAVLRLANAALRVANAGLRLANATLAVATAALRTAKTILAVRNAGLRLAKTGLRVGKMILAMRNAAVRGPHGGVLSRKALKISLCAIESREMVSPSVPAGMALGHQGGRPGDGAKPQALRPADTLARQLAPGPLLRLCRALAVRPQKG